MLIAHPDDEVFCSGLLFHLAKHFNARITLACATRGEGGAFGAETISPEQLGELRSAELAESARALGVQNTGFFGFRDPVSEKPAFETPQADVEDALAIAIVREDPSVIITHGSSGEYWHPAHTALHRAAVSRADTVPVLTFNAWQPRHPLPHLLNKDDAAHFFLDTAPYADARLRALTEHRSQAGVFERWARGTIANTFEKSRIESYCLHDRKKNQP